ncbi:MAG: patatin-like phospholipase family protein [Candidatus Aminicenantes bacterium]|nr:patatin-like phospholipase family protein [Candidatus Aminicenantes bacterium]
MMKGILRLFKKKKPKWALVLMGGGSRGLAHIGILNVLQKNGLTPDIIVGTSMGAVIGGLFASGISPTKLKEIANDFNINNFIGRPNLPILSKKSQISILDFLMHESYKSRLLKKLGLNKEDKMEAYLRNLTGEVCIEELPVKFACNAVDLISGREIIFENGKLYKALRATMSVPILFEPTKIDDMLLLDGGVLNIAPVEIARNLDAHKVILVDVHKDMKEVPTEEIKNTFQLLYRMVEAMVAYTTEDKIKKADLVIRVNLEMDALDYSDYLRIVETGENIGNENIDKIKKLVS